MSNRSELTTGRPVAEVLPDDVKKALGETNLQVEIYPGHQLVVIRFRRALDIKDRIVPLPFNVVDMLYLSRLHVKVALDNHGGVPVPTGDTTPAPNLGIVQ